TETGSTQFGSTISQPVWNITSSPKLLDLTILPLRVSTSCKEVNESYLIRLTSKRRTVRTYGFVTTSGSVSDSIPECYL
ncbi:hypothetical protein LINGRAHAP2_LOCUS23172, partial [Linum grandiflorum]